jgi:hypothetical protein
MRPGLTLLFLVASVALVQAQDSPKGTHILRQRMLIQQKVNKGWDERLDLIRSQQVAADCKAAAKKRYSAVRFKKRRAFVKNCIDNAAR